MVRLNKKTIMLLSFAIGSLMFVTTAIAEVASKSGYDQAKAALKNTADKLDGKLSSYTMDVSYVLKDNGKVVSSVNMVNKYDIGKVACENKTSIVQGAGKREDEYYREKNNITIYNNLDGVYHQYEISDPKMQVGVNNPFKEKSTDDIEKIADAFVGNLKDYVVVSEKGDGSKELTGSISESQIPTLANAVVSYEVKHLAVQEKDIKGQNIMPTIVKDVFVKEAKGSMVIDKNGFIESVLGTGVISGKDEKGIEHSLTFEVLGKVYNVNSTVVSPPDLTGKKVQKDTNQYNKIVSNPEIMVGKYKSDLIILKDNKFEKIGERIVEIDQIDDKNVIGKCHYEFKKEYEKYAVDAKDFNFNAQFKNGNETLEFNSTNFKGKGIKGNMYIDYKGAKICFWVADDDKDLIINPYYCRVFD